MVKMKELTRAVSVKNMIIATFSLNLLIMPIAMAGMINPGANFAWVSIDNSNIEIVGPAVVKIKKRNIKTGEISDHELVAGPNGSIKIIDTKQKGGRGKVTAVTGDPLINLEGSVDFGTGIFQLETDGIADLFSNVTVDLTFLYGSFNAAITNPGNQLIGPDGDNTFVNWTTSWESLDPIGQFSEGTDNFDLILGTFDLNGISEPAPGLRPFEFSYEFLSSTTGTMNFTVQDELVLGGNSYLGQVSKQLDFDVPEPSCLSLLTLGLLGTLAFIRKRSFR